MLQAMTACGATVRARGPANDHTRSAGERQSAAVSPEPSAPERAAAGGVPDWSRPAGPTARRHLRPAGPTARRHLQPAGPVDRPAAGRTDGGPHSAIVKWRGRVVARRSCKLVQL